MDSAAPLFAGWKETMEWTCLQGHMGTVATDGRTPPESALCAVGDFCFLAGKPDPELARHAAILHDCTKYLGLEDQLHLCEKYGIELDSLERQAVKLLHSKTGACIAKYVFGEPDEVYEAIFWHTTGKADMTLLDKVLYMADYIEPNRDFDGVEELRKLAYTDLDQAMLLGVDSTIREMEERGYLIHTNTREARQWLLDQGVKLKE